MNVFGLSFVLFTLKLSAGKGFYRTPQSIFIVCKWVVHGLFKIFQNYVKNKINN